MEATITKYANWELWNDVANIKGELTDKEVADIAAVKKLRVVQPLKYIPKEETWYQLNKQVFKHRPEVYLHIWEDTAPVGFEFLGEMSEVRDLRINQVKFKDNNTLAKLVNLKKLSITNGNVTDLGFLENFHQLEELEIQLVKNFEELSFVSEITSLNRLFLYGLKNITHLPDFKNNVNLQVVNLRTMKGLTDVSSLADVKDLRYLRFYDLSPELEPQQFSFLKDAKHISDIMGMFNTKPKDKVFKEMIGSLPLWQAVDDGNTINTTGPDGGNIILDEEHPFGARITYEENSRIAPLSITLGIYGCLMHTYMSDDAKEIVFKHYNWFKRKIEDFFFLEEEDQEGRSRIVNEIADK